MTGTGNYSGPPPEGVVGEFHAVPRVRNTPTSNLSVAEAAAVRRVGLSPAGFVMGSAVMQLAWAITGNIYGGGGLGGAMEPVGGRFSG